MASIRKRGNTYQIIVSCGYKNGKKQTATCTYHPDEGMTAKQAAQAASAYACEFESKILANVITTGDRMNLKDYAALWLENYARPNLQPHTVESYEGYLNKLIIPRLGKVRLRNMKPYTLTQFYMDLTKDGTRLDGKDGGYSPATIRRIHTLLSSMLHTAVYWEMLNNNPCDRVRLPTVPAAAEQIKYLTPEQTVALLNFSEQSYQIEVAAQNRVTNHGIPYHVNAYTVHHSISLQQQVLITLAIYTGMRCGELLALRWSDIDLETGTISISHSLCWIKGDYIIKSPKTKSSYRTIAIPDSVIERLKEHKQSQDAYINSVDDYWKGDPDDSFVFTQQDGKPMYSSTPLGVLKKMITRYNDRHSDAEALPMIPFHGLRHTNATLMIADHQDARTVANRLGHSHTSTTLNIYSHALRDVDRDAVESLENLLENNPQRIKKESQDEP